MTSSASKSCHVKKETTPLLEKSSEVSLRAYVYILISSCASSIVGFLIHVVLTKYGFSTLSCTIIRGTIPTGLALITLALVRPPAPSRTQIPLLVVRGILGSSGIICNYNSLRRLPLGTNRSILATSPAITSLFCAVFLGEHLTPLELVALAASFVGVVLVAQPANRAEHLRGNPWVGALFALGSAIFSSAAKTIVRVLGTSVHPVHNVVTLSVCVMVWTALLARRSDYDAVFSNMSGSVLMIIGTALGFVGMSLFITGLQRCRGGPGLLIGTTSIPLSYALGLLFLGERSGWSGVIGSVLIVGAAVAVGLSSSLPVAHDGMREDEEQERSSKVEDVSGTQRTGKCGVEK